MKDNVLMFEAAYRRSLRECLDGAGEVALQHGYELGRQAIRNGLGVMDVASAHRKALLNLLAAPQSAEGCIRIVQLSQEFFTECLAPFELTHRGFLEVELLNHKLEAANRELESFSYSVSHDLRAPLRAIDGYSRMILKRQEEYFDEETKRQFGSIRDNVKTMGCLIDDLLSFSRLGKQEMSKTMLDVEEMIREIWQNLLIVNPDRNMTLKVEGIQPAMGDRSLIREVLSNLLGNAVKFTRGRKVALIEAGSHVQGEEVVYFVKDNGVGFDMKYYEKLFGVFQRLHGTEYEGTGIGLALVQRIISRHNGRVWAEGLIDGGAVFSFTLPVSGLG